MLSEEEKKKRAERFGIKPAPLSNERLQQRQQRFGNQKNGGGKKGGNNTPAVVLSPEDEEKKRKRAERFQQSDADKKAKV